MTFFEKVNSAEECLIVNPCQPHIAKTALDTRIAVKSYLKTELIGTHSLVSLTPAKY